MDRPAPKTQDPLAERLEELNMGMPSAFVLEYVHRGEVVADLVLGVAHALKSLVGAARSLAHRTASAA